MDRFDKKGMIVIPNPVKKPTQKEKVLIVSELFCQNGHDLINDRAVFNGYKGILIGVELDNKRGFVALSPIYGDKTRISIDINLPDGRFVKLFCPVCGIDLPVYANCGCGGDLIALFLTGEANFMDCIGVCNRIGCINARFVTSGKLISETMLESL
jgi:hypothetical protein